MRDFREAMVETLEGRTFLSGGGYIHAETTTFVIESGVVSSGAVQAQFPAAPQLTISITIEAPMIKFAPPGGHYGRIIHHDFDFAVPRLLPPVPPPMTTPPPVEAPSEPVTEPAPPAKEEAKPVAPPTVVSHEKQQDDAAGRSASVVAVVPEHAVIPVHGGETAAVEVVDASGSHPVVTSLATATHERSSNVFAALFSRTFADGAGAIAKTMQIAAAAPSMVANAVPAAAKTLESALAPKRVFHFERLSNPLALIGDAAAAFAEESALLGSGMTGGRFARAWGITGAVVAFDAAILVYWAHARRRRAVAHSIWSIDMAAEIE